MFSCFEHGPLVLTMQSMDGPDQERLFLFAIYDTRWRSGCFIVQEYDRGGTAMLRIRVLIVDDQRLFRERLRVLLGNYPDLEVVGEAADGADALTVARAVQPAVA